MKVSNKYDSGIAMVYHRWGLAPPVTSKSDGRANVYGTFFFADEMTHAVQNLFSPLADYKQRTADARTRFFLLGNFDNPDHK